MFVGNKNTQTALGPALQAAIKLLVSMNPISKKVTITSVSKISIYIALQYEYEMLHLEVCMNVCKCTPYIHV